MNQNFEKMEVTLQFRDNPFRTEIENALIDYCDQNKIIYTLQDYYITYNLYPDARYRCFRVTVHFFGRLRNADDILREQIEFKIKCLEE